MKINAKVGNGTPVTVDYDFPDTLDGLIEKFGHETVYGKAMDSLVIDVQALVRRHLTAKTDKDGKVTTPPKSEEEIQAIVDGWMPGVGRTKTSSVDKAKNLIKGLSPEERAALLASLAD